jgi:DNA mismatch repair protein MutL
MPEIRILDDRLVSQIAAGEVVERPASVVKELVENALDAGATDVRVELEGGGKRRIRVSDDGRGMGRDDALLAFDRHATSKIEAFEDLERVASLGFRGEALASIAAVARVELVTAREPGDGTRVRIEGGRVRSAEPVAQPRGTRVEVASLFYNVPARRKFLKRPATELRRAAEVVQGYALARPEIGFSLRHEGRVMLETVPGGEGPEGSRARIREVFGAELTRHLVELPPGSPVDREIVWGHVGDPSTAGSKRRFVFVNRRLLRDRAVLATFYRAVREEWHGDAFPALFLFLDLPPELVDVNVHPQKSEVRFREPALLDRLFHRLRDGLAAARGEEPAPLGPPAERPEAAPLAWRGLGEWSPAGEVREPGAVPPLTGAGPHLAEAVFTPVQRPVVPLSGRRGERRSFRLLGQYKGTLILLEGPRGLMLIDQHVAHERILYERFRRALEGQRAASQALLEPVMIELSPSEALRLAELADGLERCGFELRQLSGGSFAMAGVPAELGVEAARELVLEVAASGESVATAEEVRERILDGLAAGLSCRAAIKMHHPLTPQEMEALVAELFVADQPYACPHGRPVVLEMTDADLEHRFKRR